VRSIQIREEHWVVADLLGKAGHLRTIPIPTWTNAVSFVQTFEKTGDYWMASANRSVTEAKMFGEADLLIKHSGYNFKPVVMMAAN
jgi:hypothetical protein